MPVTLDIRTNVQDVLATFNDHQKRKLPLITAMALTWTSKLIEAAERQEMRRVFDRPVNWTLNSLYTKPATVKDLRSWVGFKDFGPKGTPAGKYLRYQIDGGGRVHTGFESALKRAGVLPAELFAVPTARMRLDAYGNVPKGLHTKVLSDLQASPDPTQNRNGAKKGRGKFRMMSFFAISRPGNGMAPGIYLNIGVGKQALMWAFVRQPMYAKRFDWFGIARRTAIDGFPKSFRQAAQQIGWGQRRKAA